MYNEQKKVLGLPQPLLVKMAFKLALILILLVVAFTAYKVHSDRLAEQRMSYYTSEYQAVFLTSGQVYFGSVTDRTSEDMYMEEVYYLKVDSAEDAANLETGADISILRLFNEIHGPEDSIQINRLDVRYIENLRDDSEIVKAIKAYKSGGNN